MPQANRIFVVVAPIFECYQAPKSASSPSCQPIFQSSGRGMTVRVHYDISHRRNGRHGFLSFMGFWGALGLVLALNFVQTAKQTRLASLLVQESKRPRRVKIMCHSFFPLPAPDSITRLRERVDVGERFQAAACGKRLLGLVALRMCCAARLCVAEGMLFAPHLTLHQLTLAAQGFCLSAFDEAG